MHGVTRNGRFRRINQGRLFEMVFHMWSRRLEIAHVRGTKEL